MAFLALPFMSRHNELAMYRSEAAVMLACSAIILQLSVLTLIYVQRCRAYFRTVEEMRYQVVIDGTRNCSELPPPYEEAEERPPTYEQAIQQSGTAPTAAVPAAQYV